MTENPWETLAIAVGGFTPIIFVGIIVVAKELDTLKSHSGGYDSLSIPSFVTHSVGKYEKFKGILELKAIDQAVTGSPVSMSLDGVFAEIHEPRIYSTFVFDLGAIKEKAKPVIYLLSAGVTPEPKDGYYLQNWKYFPEAELVFEGSIPINLVRCIIPSKKADYEIKEEATVSGINICEELEQSDFRGEVMTQYKFTEERGCPIEPPEWIRDFLHEYNRTICRIFNLDYQDIIRNARKYPRHVYTLF